MGNACQTGESSAGKDVESSDPIKQVHEDRNTISAEELTKFAKRAEEYLEEVAKKRAVIAAEEKAAEEAAAAKAAEEAAVAKAAEEAAAAKAAKEASSVKAAEVALAGQVVEQAAAA